MTELIVAFLKFCVWDPYWDALCFLEHTLVDVTLEIILERVGMAAESSNPEFPPNFRSHTENSIIQATIGLWVRFSVPSSVADKGVSGCSAIRRF
jgi:hypothetical protein